MISFSNEKIPVLIKTDDLYLYRLHDSQRPFKNLLSKPRNYYSCPNRFHRHHPQGHSTIFEPKII